MTKLEYHDQVIKYLEYLSYPELIIEFNDMDVAKSISNTIKIMYNGGLSHRWAALSIFGMTMYYQVIPQSKKLSRNN